MVEHKGLSVQMTAATIIAVPLCQFGRTLHSLWDIGVDDKDSSNDKNTSRTSKAGPRVQLAEVLGKVALIITDDVSMMKRKLFDLGDVILENLKRRASKEHRFQLGGIRVVLAGD